MIEECNDLNGIAEIWCEAFGDTFDDVKYFENDVINNDYLIVGCSLKEPIVLLNTED